LEFQLSTDRDLAEGFLEMKEAEAKDQHKSITGALKSAAASPEWEFEQINFVMCNRGLVVESNCHTKLKKLDVQEGKQNKLFADSAQSGECVLPPAGARRYEANYPRDRGRTLGTICTCEEIEGGTLAQACTASKLGPVERWWTQDDKLGITAQSETLPKSPEDGRISGILLIRIAFCHVSENLPPHCLVYVTMNIDFCLLC